MARQNYEMSILFGIADFYHRYGYSPAFSEQSVTCEAAQLRRLSSAYVTRKMKVSDLKAIRRLYGKHNAERCGMDARLKGWVPAWRMPRIGEGTTRRPGQVLVVCDGGDRVKGFVVFDAQAGRLVVSEVCGTDRLALVAIGSAIGSRARRASAEHVRFCLPSDDPLLDILVPLGYTASVRYPFKGGSMGRIISLQPLFQKMTGVFSGRLMTSRLDWAGELVLKTDIGTVGLHIGKKDVSVNDRHGRPQILIPQMALSQLIMGYRTVDEVAHDSGVTIPKRLLAVLRVLFPKGNPYMWWSDRF